ncbi:MAG: hypothetical protein U0837_03560 [Dehalococcoidia bacterium]|jgi:Tol biopolymer transport system component
MESRLVATTALGSTTVLTPPGDAQASPEANTPRTAMWTTWRPGHGSLTWSQVDEEASLRADGQEVPGATTRPPLFLGPGLPHYALWSGRGRRLAYVVPDGRSLVLKVWTPGEPDAKALLAAAPVFFAWLPSENVLFIHHGTVLQRFDLESGEQVVFSQSAAGFRTPAISPDGSRVAWAEVRDGAVHVLESPAAGPDPRDLRSFNAGVVLSYVSDGRLIAAVGSSPESLAFASLQDVHASRALVRAVLTAAWFSPDGSKVVSLHPTFTGDGRYQAKLWDGTGRALGAIEPFVPSAQVGTVVNFYDQYQLSHPVWSADSRWFALCGRPATDGPHPAFHDGIQDYVWLWDTVSGTVTRRAAPGAIAAFER